MIALLAASALAGGPELTLAAGTSGSPWLERQPALAIGAGLPLTRTWGVDARVARYGAPAGTTIERGDLGGSADDPRVPPEDWVAPAHVQLVDLTASAAVVWTPIRGRMSLADEAAVDLDVRVIGGIVGLSQGSYEVVDDGALRAGSNEVLAGPTFGAGARIWLGRHAAIDLDARHLVWVDEVVVAPESLAEQLVMRFERRTFSTTTLSVGVTVAAGRRPEPLPPS